jgi:hypothetical protein
VANPATTADIEARWRTLTATETTVATTRLADAWRKLKRDIPDLESRMVGNADLTADTVRVLSDAVIRLLQSLERRGLRKGAVGVDDGSTSWELDASIRTDLYFTPDEIADLSSTGRRTRARAFSVQPT